MHTAGPFTFNFAALAIVPITVIKATTAVEQIDIIYDLADNPATPKELASELARLAGKMMAKMPKGTEK